MGKGDFAIIGTGEVRHGMFPERSEFEIAYTVARAAVKDAGIEMKDVGAVLTAAHIMGTEYNTEMFFGHLPEAIGARNNKVYATTVSGGGSSSSIMKTADRHTRVRCNRYGSCGACTTLFPVQCK